MLSYLRRTNPAKIQLERVERKLDNLVWFACSLSLSENIKIQLWLSSGYFPAGPAQREGLGGL